MSFVSIVLPTFNERENITSLVDEILEVLGESGLDGEVIVVDDKSPDGTGTLAQTLAKNTANVKVLTNKRRIGLAPSILNGVRASSGKTVVVMDSDGSHHPAVIPSLVSGLDKAEVCIASRYFKGGGMEAPKYKYHLSRMLNMAVKKILDINVEDSTGGFFAIKKNALSSVDLEFIFTGYGDYFFRLLYLLKKEGKVFVEIPFEYRRRK